MCYVFYHIIKPSPIFFRKAAGVEDRAKAEELFQCCSGKLSVLGGNKYYKHLVANVSRHQPVTRKDLKYMFPTEYKKDDKLKSWLSNGYLDISAGPLKTE